jgi:hypothetical protein
MKEADLGRFPFIALSRLIVLALDLLKNWKAKSIGLEESLTPLRKSVRRPAVISRIRRVALVAMAAAVPVISGLGQSNGEPASRFTARFTWHPTPDPEIPSGSNQIVARSHKI